MTNIHLIFPEVSRGYINLTQKDQLAKALKKNTRKFKKVLKNIPEKKIDYSYAEGKWTIRQMLQHIIDAERVFAYRALWFARKDSQPLPGFDENAWALQAPASSRKWEDMVREFKVLRKSTELMFASFSEDDLNATGISNNNEYSVAAFGYITAGHVAHHMNVIKERYLR
jgi:hypothetical protein